MEDRRLLAVNAELQISLDPDDVTTIFESIEEQFERDTFEFPIPGEVGDPPFVLTVTQRAVGQSSLDSLLTAFNSAGLLLTSSDDEDGSLNSELEFLALPGQTYSVEAAGFFISTGDYQLDFTLGNAADDFPNTPEDAIELELGSSNATSIVGTIDPVDDVDVFRVTPTATGQLEIALSALDAAGSGGFDGLLVVRDKAGDVLAMDDDGGGKGNSFIQLNTAANTTLFIEVRASDSATDDTNTGDYSLVVSAGDAPQDDFGDTLDDAHDLPPLDAHGNGSQFGTIEGPGDKDAFSFVSPITGELLIAAKRFPASRLDTFLEVFDADERLIGFNDDRDRETSQSRVRFEVTQGDTYFARVSGFGQSFGEYVLSLAQPNQPDDYGDSSADAYVLNYPSSGSASIRGETEIPGDQDVFRFTTPSQTPINSPMSIALRRAEDNGIDEGVITVLDIMGSEIGRAVLSSSVSSVEVPTFLVSPNETFDVFINGLAGGTGKYFIDFAVAGSSEDDFPINPFADANADMPALIPLSPTGFGSQSGVLGETGDAFDPLGWDVFEFIPENDGTVTLSREPPDADSLRYSVDVFLASDRSTPIQTMTSGDVRLDIPVQEGVRYWLLVKPTFRSALPGRYDLFLTATEPLPVEDQVGNEFANASEIALDPDGFGQVSAVVNGPGDDDFFRFEAQISGTLLVAQSAAAGSPLDSVLTAFDGAGRELRESRGHDGSLDPLLAFQVVMGQIYFLRAAGNNSSFGGYDLSFRTVSDGLEIDEFENGDPQIGRRLVEELLGGTLSAAGIEVLPNSIIYSGAGQAAGIFRNGDGILDSQDSVVFDQGILLTTGRATNAIGPNFSRGASTDNRAFLNPAFADLFSQLAPATEVINPGVLSFEFTPTTNTIEFDFVFASEEYHEFVNSGFNDVFGLFVNDVNFARVPGTDNYIAGTGDVISIDTVNRVANRDIFVDNAFRPTAPFGPLNIEYDGLTRVIRVRAPVTEGELNNVTFAIADVRDRLFDSAVFVRALSLASESEEVEDQKGTALVSEFTNIISDVVASSAAATEEQIHLDIHQQFVRSVLKDVGIDLVGDFLVIPVDPVDYTLLAPDGSTVQGGTNFSSSVPNVFFSRQGTDELLILPNAATGQYTVQLVGVGTGDFRFGASFVEASGRVTTRLFQGNLVDGNTIVILDFRVLTSDVLSLTFKPPAAQSEPIGFLPSALLDVGGDLALMRPAAGTFLLARFGGPSAAAVSDSGSQLGTDSAALSLVAGGGGDATANRASDSDGAVRRAARAVLDPLGDFLATRIFSQSNARSNLLRWHILDAALGPLAPWVIFVDIGWQLFSDQPGETEDEDAPVTPAGDNANGTQRLGTLLGQIMPWRLVLEAIQAQISSEGEAPQNADTEGGTAAEPQGTTNSAENPEEAAVPVPNPRLGGDENASAEAPGSLPRESTTATAVHPRGRGGDATVGAEITACVLTSLAIAGRVNDYAWISRREENGRWADRVDRLMERLLA